MLGVRGDEDDMPDEGLDCLANLESIEIWHSDVEEDDVRAEIAYDPRDLASVGALSDDIEIRGLVEQLSEPPARQGLVVDENDGVRTGNHVVSWSAGAPPIGRGDVFRGITMRTVTPPSARGMSVSEARSP